MVHAMHCLCATMCAALLASCNYPSLPRLAGNDDPEDPGVVARCGNGLMESSEECDSGPANGCPGDQCSLECRTVSCGNGFTEQCEVCDDGNDVTGDGCSHSCQSLEVCGNGIADPGEECDNGLANSINGDCRPDCLINRCGDGYLNTQGFHKEQCELLADPVPSGSHMLSFVETATCNVNCTPAACGDNIINRLFRPSKLDHPAERLTTEQCDDGARVSGDGCSEDCQFERCGNDIVDPGEECDGSAGGQPCSPTCSHRGCGNGIVDPGEECDQGAENADNADCRSDCVINRCGDGHVNSSTGPNREACDGGPLAGPGDRKATPTNTSNCDSDCTMPSCGDGFVNNKFVVPATALIEQCDPPSAGNRCSAICQVMP